MLNFYSCYSKAVNPEKAIKESITKTASDEIIEPDLIVLHSTLGYDLPKLLSAIKRAHPKVEIVGCTGSGVISNGWVSESMRAMAAIVIAGNEFVTASISGVTVENSESLAQQCAEKLITKCDDVNMLMVFAPGIEVNAEGIISGVESVFGKEVPILGGTSGFSGKTPKTPVFFGEEELEQAIVMVGFFDPGLEVIQSSHHGYLPQKDFEFTVTKTEGNRVDELNGEAAWPTLMNSFSFPVDTSALDLIPILALGTALNEPEKEEYDNECILRAPLLVDENRKSFIMPAPVQQGIKLISCQRNEDYLFEGMKRLGGRLLGQLEGREPVAIFQIDCMARGRLTMGKIEKDEIIKILQNAVMGDSTIPWLGDYGFGEFAKLCNVNRFHNYTTSLSMIVRK
jgi:hypothetical protein